MDEALEYLISLVRSGVEFPDAAWKSATKFRVNQSELESAYDLV